MLKQTDLLVNTLWILNKGINTIKLKLQLLSDNVWEHVFKINKET